MKQQSVNRQIGETAGMLWKFLDKNGECNLSQLKKGVDASNSLLHQALGWLARENKLSIVRGKRSFKINLTDPAARKS